MGQSIATVETLEAVVLSNVVQLATYNQMLRNHLANAPKTDPKQFLDQFEQQLKNDLERAEKEVPSFLADLSITQEFRARMRQIHLDSLYAAICADATTAIEVLVERFGVQGPAIPEPVGGTPAPVPPPAPPAPPVALAPTETETEG